MLPYNEHMKIANRRAPLPLVSASALPAPAALALDAVLGPRAAATTAVPGAAAATAAALLSSQFVL